MGLIRNLARKIGHRLSGISKTLGLESAFNFFSFGGRTVQSRNADYNTFLKSVLKSEWAAISIMRIADAIIFNNWQIRDVQTGKPVDKRHPAVSLFMNPNPLQTWHNFVEELIWHWLPTGNAYIWKRPSAAGSTIPSQLWLLRPDRVKIVPDPETLIGHYELTVDGGKTRTIPREQIEHIRFGNPLNPFLGLGRVEVAPRLYDTDIAAAEYSARFWENDASPGSVLSVEGQLSDDTLRHLKEMWNEEHRGYRKAHRMTILEQGLKHSSEGTSPRESDFLQTRKANREAILALFGVQPLQAGITEGANRATAFVQKWLFQRDTIAPLTARLSSSLTNITQLFADLGFFFEAQVQEDSVEDSQIAQQYFTVGAITPNEIRTIYAGLPKVENNPAMDKHYFQNGLFEVGEAPAPGPGAFSAEPPEPPAPAADAHMHDHEVKQGTPLQQRILKHYRMRQTVQTKKMRLAVAKFFKDQGERTIDRFLHGKAAPGAEVKGIDDIFDPVQDEKVWREVMTFSLGSAISEEFTITSRLMGYAPGPDVLPFAPGEVTFDRRLTRLASKVTRVSEVTRAKLAAVLDEGISLGLNPTAIANGAPEQAYPGIRGIFDSEFSRGRAMTIARTESARALDQANTAVYKGLGVTLCDVIGCEDSVIMPGQKWGCNSKGVPIDEIEATEFHPNHKGAVVPRISQARLIAQALAGLKAAGA
jgi:HK97 family phage portal protein